jgi:hypothetical protein
MKCVLVPAAREKPRWQCVGLSRSPCLLRPARQMSTARPYMPYCVFDLVPFESFLSCPHLFGSDQECDARRTRAFNHPIWIWRGACKFLSGPSLSRETNMLLYLATLWSYERSAFACRLYYPYGCVVSSASRKPRRAGSLPLVPRPPFFAGGFR